MMNSYVMIMIMSDYHPKYLEEVNLQLKTQKTRLFDLHMGWSKPDVCWKSEI